MSKELIRLATVVDLPLIDRLSNEILAEHDLPEDSAVAALDSKYFSGDGAVNLKQACFWLAVEGDQVIGSAAVVPHSSSTCIFKTFYVKAEYRGIRIGYNLYACAESFARTSVYQRIRLYVSRRFQKAIDFYLRNGY